MSEPSEPSRARPAWLFDDAPVAPKRSRLRRVLGCGATVLAALLAVVFVLGTWNPWDLVVLLRYFGNPLAGAVWVSGLLLAGLWLLTPVVVDATQGRRLWVRLVLGGVLLLALGAWGIAGSQFSGEYKVLVESADGSRRLVMRTQIEDRELRVWAGTGLGARDMGRLGLACGDVVGRFEGNDRVRVASVYGDFDLRLDPETGAPVNTIGPTCSG